MNKMIITFDLDGTLMQNPFVGWVFPELEEIIQTALGQPFPVKQTLVAEHERRLEQQLVSAYDWDQIVAKCIAELRLSIEINVEELVIKHCEKPKIYLLEETTLKVLQQLKEQGILLAAVTNGYYKYQYPVMEKLGLVEMFDKIITSDRVGYNKPDVRILSQLKERGQIIAHIGDRIDHDIQLANQLVTTSVLYFRKLPPELREVAPLERIKHKQMKQLCAEKWRKESYQEGNVSLSPFPMPQAVICSIEELGACV